jgi:hypothetical protein
MPADDALYGRKAYPGAFEIRRGMHTLERAEQVPGVFHIETRAIVTDEINGPDIFT